MKIAIMQPYFMPYIGYFQLIYNTDLFVVYDKIEYTKKGWINRNRILVNGEIKTITIPLKKDSDYLNVDERIISDAYNKEKLLNLIRSSYKKASYYEEAYEVIEKIVNYDNENLFEYIFNSIKLICEYLRIDTKIIKSSDLNYDNSLKSQEKVLAICESAKANVYINSIGGKELYSKDEFSKNSVELKFLRPKLISYEQSCSDFIPALSIIDVIMNNSIESINEMLNEYSFE